MTETLLHAYTPLILWIGLGLLLLRVLPDTLPQLLGRWLYWVGVPLQILALTRSTDFSQNVGLAPIIAIAALSVGLGLALLGLKGKDLPDRASKGSFVLASMLGNTGFVGLAIASSLIDPSFLGGAVFYSITHNLLGSYGIGVLTASYFSRGDLGERGWKQLRDILTVPSLWAFLSGYLTDSVVLPEFLESSLQGSLAIVIPSALFLMGMRLGQIQGWKSLSVATIPAIIKTVLMPGLVAIALTMLGIIGDRRLVLVLMSGMPTAFAGLILAEEYDLNRDLIASSIVVSTGLLLLTIPLWLLLLG